MKIIQVFGTNLTLNSNVIHLDARMKFWIPNRDAEKPLGSLVPVKRHKIRRLYRIVEGGGVNGDLENGLDKRGEFGINEKEFVCVCRGLGLGPYVQATDWSPSCYAPKNLIYIISFDSTDPQSSLPLRPLVQSTVQRILLLLHQRLSSFATAVREDASANCWPDASGQVYSSAVEKSGQDREITVLSGGAERGSGTSPTILLVRGKGGPSGVSSGCPSSWSPSGLAGGLPGRQQPLRRLSR
ncbi:unnamed protein product [Nezara viridula]|uniref:Uncharacterized protein n=1 Tax=Nezara viridula TaxID=85310 RepID=A0A9P0MSL6_NEZVI|nr:unnamed protein product [Nezara viridula]